MKATTMLPHQWAEPSTKKPKSRPPKNEPMSPTMIAPMMPKPPPFIARPAGQPARDQVHEQPRDHPARSEYGRYIRETHCHPLSCARETSN